MKKRIYLIWLFTFTTFSMLAQKKNDKPYYEDLSLVRPKVEASVDTFKTAGAQPVKSNEAITPTHTVNEKVDFVLDSISRFNQIRRSVDGFTIQIYSGQKRDDAMNAKKKISDEFSDLTANLQYQQPKFRVTVGKYYTRLEAYQDLARIRNGFPAAILIPEKIPVR